MSLLSRLFGGRAAHADEPSFLSTVSSLGGKNGRRDLLRLVMRDVMQLHGVPLDWITAEMLTSMLVTGGKGIHWRLHVRHWDPRLLTYAPALQDALVEHLLTLDPEAEQWLTGVSWQLSLDDRARCPPMPAPETWLTAPRLNAPRPRTPEHNVESARADLNRWLASKPGDLPRPLDELPPTWANTQPAPP